jgi:hypothetical protein
MDDISLPDIIEPLRAEMERRRVAPKMIRIFEELWSQLKPNSRMLPCPVCFAKGCIGRIAVQPRDRYGSTTVRCNECDAEIVVRRVN